MKAVSVAGKFQPISPINWNDPRKPFGERLYKATEYLRFKARNRNAANACETVGQIVSEAQKYRLFQKFFPEEWRKSKASFFKTGDYVHYSERTCEFFSLVHQKMFPLLEGWNDDPETDFENFYIFSLNYDLCCEELEYEHLHASYVAGLIFYFRDDDGIWEFFAKNYNVARADLPEICERPNQKIWGLERTGKIGLYVNLLELVDHSTGNPWLDTVNCQGSGYFGWDEDTFLFLAESYKEAVRLLEQSCQVDALIAQDAHAVLLDLITLWNEGRLPPERKNRRWAKEAKI
jgi:hypothetical protein